MIDPDTTLLSEFISRAKYNLSINAQVAILKNKFTQATTVAVNGGQFHITEARLMFNSYILSSGNTTTVLIDDNNTPIRIDDLPALQQSWQWSWNSATNEFLAEYTKLRKARRVEQLIAG